MTEQMTEEQAAALRAPFPEGSVGKLPRTTCKACSDRNCQQHRKVRCNECGAYISEAHIHLDYIGHAGVTDRLLSVDPAWSWEPAALDANGAPLITYVNNRWVLWIRLTVCGVTRLGVGTCGQTFDPEKELIGDALRNAAMRFGVALDLWSKEELESSTRVDDPPPQRPSEAFGGAPPTPGHAAAAAAPAATGPQLQKLNAALTEIGVASKDRDARLYFVNRALGRLDHPIGSSKELTRAEASTVLDIVEKVRVGGMRLEVDDATGFPYGQEYGPGEEPWPMEDESDG